MNTPEHARAQLSATISQGLQHALQAHRAYTETLAEQAIRDGDALGFIDVEGEGECLAEVTFPLTFLERPVFSPGLELADNEWLEWGSFPNWSATVSSWVTRPSTGSPLYTGAIVAVRVTGAARSVLHYRFSARSITSPVGATNRAGDTL